MNLGVSEPTFHSVQNFNQIPKMYLGGGGATKYFEMYPLCDASFQTSQKTKQMMCLKYFLRSLYTMWRPGTYFHYKEMKNYILIID